MLDLETIFSPSSSLKDSIPEFNFRDAQSKMADAVKTAIEKKHPLVIEAGTGTGKTFAYLIPVLLSQKRTIISTGTKHLQDQLFHRDLPILKKALESNAKIALLKGRRNYLCHHRIKHHAEDGRFNSKDIVKQFSLIEKKLSETNSGDVAEIKEIPEDSPVWSYVTSTADNCLGQECDYIKNCFLAKARKKALEADVLVINHHLFFADIALRDIGFGELLPGAHTIIFDEAHQLPDIALNFFGLSISSRQILEFLKDSEKELLEINADIREWLNHSQFLQNNLVSLKINLGQESQRRAWFEIRYKDAVDTIVKDIQENLKSLKNILELSAQRSKGLENCFQRIIDLSARFKNLTTNPLDDHVHWFETFAKSFAIHLTPIDCAKPLQAHLKELNSTFIFTSATLAIEQDFSYFNNQTGFDKIKSLQLQTSFNFEEQAILYLPKNIPDPIDQKYIEVIVNEAIQIIKLVQGKTFFLFTSYAAMHKAFDIMQNKVKYPLLLQGQMPKNKLLEEFRKLGNAVLLATSSFWEGVDVQGEALSCVIIDKLPFASPGDPIVRAKSQALKQNGIDPFNTYQLHQAVIALKQGVGRLIRHENDRGILMICDPRIRTKSYGKSFLHSLPKMPITQNFEDVESFWGK